jgi:UDPglucose 6-dehydrogenase|tara:strand:+ start:3994 stop:4827 length:834 start_codon:yes stop_codon:yes gene_type:complete
MDLKVGIVGHGFVGKAVDYGFSNRVKKKLIDPNYKTRCEHLADFDPNVVFICAPTPMGNDGSIDATIVEQCCTEVSNFTDALIVLKSTVTPDIADRLSEQFTKFVYNPEFLTEKHANEDFVNQFMLVLGGSVENTHTLLKIYNKHSICRPCPVFHMSAAEASFVKYGINTFLATKVTFFNQMYDIAKDHGANYNAIISALGSDPRITHSHTTVPGFDNKRGFGGACFPKDTAAFDAFAKYFSILNESIKVNNEYRKNYELDDREKEQNVQYKRSDIG